MSDQTPQIIKVRALRTVIYDGIRFRGDDTMGEGQGQILELHDREVCVINDVSSRPELDRKTGEPIRRLLTAEEQFSPYNMERVPDDAPASTEYLSTQDVLTMRATGLVAEQVRGKGKSRVSA